jgi:hypothetical protein
MDFDKLASIILESPIGKFELSGKWSADDKLHGYDKASTKLLTNQRYVEKVKTAWNKTEFLFDLYFVRKPNLRQHSEIGRVDLEFVRTQLGLDIEPNPDAITVIYINNAGDEKIPLTSWILAHRVGHAMARDSTKSIPYNGADPSTNRYLYGELRREVYKAIDEVAKDIYGTDIRENRSYYSDNNSQRQNARKASIKMKVSEALGTFKSARENNLRQDFEMINELIAQYIIKGKITLNKTLPNVIPLKKFYKNTIDSVHKQQDITPEDEKDIVESKEDIINYAISSLFSGCMNSIFVM